MTEDTEASPAEPPQRDEALSLIPGDPPPLAKGMVSAADGTWDFSVRDSLTRVFSDQVGLATVIPNRSSHAAGACQLLGMVSAADGTWDFSMRDSLTSVFSDQVGRAAGSPTRGSHAPAACV